MPNNEKERLDKELIKEELEEETMLTTLDNPFNPFTEFDEWNSYDEDKAYFTCAYLARVVDTFDPESTLDVDIAVERGVNEILSFNLLGNYCRITRKGNKIKEFSLKKLINAEE